MTAGQASPGVMDLGKAAARGAEGFKPTTPSFEFKDFWRRLVPRAAAGGLLKQNLARKVSRRWIPTGASPSDVPKKKGQVKVQTEKQGRLAKKPKEAGSTGAQGTEGRGEPH